MRNEVARFLDELFIQLLTFPSEKQASERSLAFLSGALAALEHVGEISTHERRSQSQRLESVRDLPGTSEDKDRRAGANGSLVNVGGEREGRVLPLSFATHPFRGGRLSLTSMQFWADRVAIDWVFTRRAADVNQVVGRTEIKSSPFTFQVQGSDGRYLPAVGGLCVVTSDGMRGRNIFAAGEMGGELQIVIDDLTFTITK